jgi:hypothetical protein
MHWRASAKRLAARTASAVILVIAGSLTAPPSGWGLPKRKMIARHDAE